MNILIAGIPENTKNYECALSRCQVSFCTELCPKSLSSYDKLLLPGGGDMDPSWFGQKNLGSDSFDHALDKAQFALIDAFIRAGKPILGICRGLQLLNVYFGGDLIQDLPTAQRHRRLQEDQTHPAQCEESSLLARLFGPSCLVNSAHHQGCGRSGRDLKVTQTAEDGVVEALEHLVRPNILGVQWHPERTSLLSSQESLADGNLLIRYFAEQL
ncbi:MAG: gamma-glutamyl-gamma-aminobutyrate hydrolase family protein [Lachnospiraceae bacterium]|nr:gamma-glutamyl-gamma-aminobutyrate hydrolase family protein [Lachnospiraceae bacterium]